MATKTPHRDFESDIQRLEEITNQLETGEETLENAIKLYTEGLDLARHCHKALSDAEKKIKVIAEKNGLFEEVDMVGEEDL